MPQSHFQRLLVKRITDEVNRHLDGLAQGNAVDYAAYRDMVGYLRGLQDALALCADVEANME